MVCYFQFNELNLLIILINLSYWLFMECMLRYQLSSQQKEYKDTSKIIVSSIISLYFIATIWRFTNLSFLPIKEFLDCQISYSSLIILLPIFLSFFGFFLRYLSMKTLGIYFTRRLIIQNQQNIINIGPYSWIRHPGYASNILLFGCYSLILSGDLVIGLLLFGQFLYCLLVIRIPNEEEMLLNNKITSEEYKRYKLNVKYRVIPFII